MVKEKDRLNGALEAVSDGSAKTGHRRRTARDESIASLYLTPELKSQIRRLANDWGVSQSAVVRYTLRLGFEAIEGGKKPPMRKLTKAVLE